VNTPFFQKRILLGVTGSIAAYKAADLASKLAQYGAQVDVILTQAATQFITPLTFQSVTGQRAWIDADLWGAQGHVLHIGLGHSADLLVVAPASANTIARLANGIADNLLSLTALVANCPLVIAPAMDGGMYQHPATQTNLETLRQRGAILLGPASGHLASGLSGVGRMLEPAEILGHLRHLLGSSGPMQGKTVVVTASGTQEPIDPVRAICNRSSGKQGFALAQAALDLGAQVILITAPTALPTPVGATRVEVNTADEMLHAVERAVRNADVLLMAAAVADFRPVAAADHKIKKDTGIPQIFLEKTSDILSAIASQRSATGYPRIMVGFAAESEDLLENARSKMRSKHLDMIVANDISATDSGFAVDDNRVTLLDSMGGVEELPLQSKAEVAATIMQRVVVGLSNIG
jgi:phosphopantothenoylcysteine decarboxylase / phosphopantothenate---cysteine ligase